MKTILAIFLIVLELNLSAQQSVNDIKPDKEYENILVKKLNSDKNASVFVIWIKKGVKSHKHVTHTENLMIIAGEGVMTVSNKTFKVKAGDYFVVPPNTYHSLKVTSKTPMKVISVQSPEFIGKDRIFKEGKK